MKGIYTYPRAPICLIIMLAGLAPIRSDAQLTPVTVTGFNQNPIAHGTGSNPSTVTSTAFDGIAATNYVFYTVQFQGANSGTITGGGLPNSGAITNGSDTWQLQPYTGNTCLFFPPQSAVSTQTFTLTSPGSYSKIALLTSAGNGPTSVNVTLYFTGGTNTNYGAFSVLDWFSGTPYVIDNLGRVERETTITGFSGIPGNPCIYQITISLNTADQSKTISSIGITDNSTNNTATVGFFALDGLVSVLSVGLNSLQGSWQSSPDEIQLQWQSATTVPDEHFEVQRSFSGNDFTDIASITPTPDNGPQSFSYNDKAISGHAAWYYRIRDDLPAGNSEYTDIIAVQTQANGAIRLSASSTQLVIWGDLAAFSTPGGNTSNVSYYQLYTASGQLLRSGTLTGSANVIDISTLVPGVYFLRLGNGASAQALKFMKP